VDTCNGVDDDQDGRTDEDDMAVESGSPVILSTDSPYTRAPVAASSRGFFVAFGAYCVEDDNFSDIMVNHIDTDGTVTVNTRPCAAVLGRRAYTSQDRASHLPALSSSGTDTAVLAWTEQVGSQSIEMMVADLVLGGVSLSVLGPVSAGGMNSGYGATLAWGGVAMGPTAYLAGRTQGVSANERARARLVTHDGPNQLVVGDDRELGPSTEGEVAVARVGSSYAAAWVDGQSVMVRFLDAQGQPSGPGPLALARPAVPFYLQVVAVSDSRVVVAWAEAATNLGYPAEAIRLAAASVGDAHLTLVGGGFVTPEEEGHFALESAGGGELLVAVNDKAQGKLILYRVNVTTGTVCQPGVDIWDGAVGPVGMAVRGHRGLLAYLRPLGSGSQQYQVVAVRLRRSGT
jgi:hypothetical protein